VARREIKVIVALYSALVGPCPSLRPSAQEWHGVAGSEPQEATKMIRGLEHLSYSERLRELGLFNLEKAVRKPHCSLPVFKRGL